MLSLCMIAKNERANISRAIRSFADLAGEIIVVDTGSTDDTPQVARSLGARVFHSPWCDDFSHSRNQAVAHATGDWIFWLDCDEALLPQSRQAVRSAISDSGAAAFSVLRQDLVDERQQSAFTEMWQLRLFRRGLGAQFRGRCHPQFVPPLESIGAVKEAPDIRLRHWGYLAPLRAAKLRRAAHLLKLELADRPGQFYYLVELGRTLLLLGEPGAREALVEAAAMLDLSSPRPPEVMAAALLEYLMQLPQTSLPPGLTSQKVQDLAAAWFPRSVPLLAHLARNRFVAGDFRAAARLLTDFRQLSRSGEYDRNMSFDPELLGSGPTLNLAICHVRLGELAEAQALLEEIAHCPRNGAAARQNLKVVLDLRRQFHL